jgi:hypothetical protein
MSFVPFNDTQIPRKDKRRDLKHGSPQLKKPNTTSVREEPMSDLQAMLAEEKKRHLDNYIYANGHN